MSESQPLSRLAAKLSHFNNIRRVETDGEGDRAIVQLTNSGIGPEEINTIQEFGYWVSSVRIRHGYISVRSGDGQ